MNANIKQKTINNNVNLPTESSPFESLTQSIEALESVLGGMQDRSPHTYQFGPTYIQLSQMYHNLCEALDNLQFVSEHPLFSKIIKAVNAIQARDPEIKGIHLTLELSPQIHNNYAYLVFNAFPEQTPAIEDLRLRARFIPFNHPDIKNRVYSANKEMQIQSKSSNLSRSFVSSSIR